MLTVQLTGRKRVMVATLAEASTAVSEYTRGKSSSRWYANGGPDIGNVYDESGVNVARVSFNGRVWEPGPVYAPRREIVMHAESSECDAAIDAAVDSRIAPSW